MSLGFFFSENLAQPVLIKQLTLNNIKLTILELKVHITDKVSVNQIKEKLEKYLEIPRKYFAITPDNEGYYEPGSVRLINENVQLDEHTYTIKLGRILGIDEFQVQIHLLELDNSEVI